MPTRAEALFQQLQSLAAIEGLIGQTEDADFDCKVWKGKGEASSGSIAKAACAFTNATGGVIIIGVEAKGRANEPDIVTRLCPVDDAHAVCADALDAILKFLDPGIEGIQKALVFTLPEEKAGYVLLFIPATEGSPQRSRADWKFHVRISSGTVPMEYFQIEDRFGRRPHPKLSVTVSELELNHEALNHQLLKRTFELTVTNHGSGLARFPALRCRKHPHLEPSTTIRGVGGHLWTSSSADPEWFSFRGGANEVLYPGESLRVGGVSQHGERTWMLSGTMLLLAQMCDWHFPSLQIITDVVCDGMGSVLKTFDFDEANYQSPYRTSR